jgi:hypothetical protein
MGSPTCYACYGKEMLGSIREKMATQKLALGGDMFFASDSTAVGNDTSVCNSLCVAGEDCSTIAGNDYWDNAHTSDPSSRCERLGGEPNTLVQCIQHTCGSSNG